jgi:cytochrome c oxidase subunit II
MKIANVLKLLAASVLGASLAGQAAWADAGAPVPWQMNLQEAATPVSEFIHTFHFWLVILITLISLFVLGLLAYVTVKFNAKANPVPSKTTHNTTVEVLWTVIPILILVAIAIPSLRLVYYQRNIPAADMTLKVIGNPSWNWTYEYPDLGLNEDGSAKVSFTAYLKDQATAKADSVPYLLATDVPVIVPVNKTVKLIVTSDPEGIIHAWTVQSFGLKIDAVPGRLNEDWFLATKEGVYYGQCSELCGKDHAYMPIEVWVVSDDKFRIWGELRASGADDAKIGDFLKTIRPVHQVAQN